MREHLPPHGPQRAGATSEAATRATTSEVRRIARVYEGYGAAEVQARWSLDNPGNRAILQERTRVISRMLLDAGWRTLAGKRILDVGCGSGGELARMTRFGARAADLHGVDLLTERVAEARRRYRHIRFDAADATDLRGLVPSQSVDVVLAMTLFSSLLDDEVAGRVAAEMTRVLKPGGAVLYYDMRVANRANENVRPYSRGKLAELFPGFERSFKRVTLAPPLARRLGGTTRWAYPLLATLPPLRTHYVGWLRRK